MSAPADFVQRIIDYLLSRPAVTALTGPDRIVGGLDLPQGYTPDAGGLVLITKRGGPRGRGTAPIIRPGIWTRCYGATDIACSELDRIVMRELDGAAISGGRITLETDAQPSQQEVTGWPFVLTIYRLTTTF